MKILLLALLLASCGGGSRETGLGGMTDAEYAAWRQAQTKEVRP